MTETGNTGLSRKDRQAVAAALINAAGNLVESFADRPDCGYYDGIKHLSTDEVAGCLADLLKRMPGESWDLRLPDPGSTR